MTEELLRSDQGLRIESLGDNCELGFVMRRLGHDSGSLFRWASMKPQSLLAMLRADLAGFYRFEDLSPLRAAMVCDDAYGIGWHSDMRGHAVGGRMAFVDDRQTRLAIHLREQRKLRYLVAKFRARASLGGMLFVIKSNPGIEPELIDAVFEQLTRLAGGAAFTLLEVQAAPEPDRIGQVERRRDGLLRGYVSGFAGYETADKMDFSAWSAVLHNALSMESCPGWTARLRQLHVEVVENAISLPFPPAADADLSRPLIGDLRGGAVRLLHGNEWCRPVDGAFRLHGPSREHPAARLYWANLRGAGRHQLGGTVHCPIQELGAVGLGHPGNRRGGRGLLAAAAHGRAGRPKGIVHAVRLGPGDRPAAGGPGSAPIEDRRTLRGGPRRPDAVAGGGGGRGAGRLTAACSRGGA